MPRLSEDPNFHYETIRSLGAVRYMGGDIGEQLRVIDRIRPGNFEDWYREWYALARRVLSTIDENDESKHTTASLKDAYFRASHYFFMADFFLHGDPTDPRLNENFKLWRHYFDKANEKLPNPGKHYTVQTPHGFTVPLIAYRAPEASHSNPRPTLLIAGGFDSNYEECVHDFAFAALERGYNAILYEGPGQPRLLQEQQKGFIVEWEKVVTPVMDFLASSDDFSYVNKRQVSLLGLSLGGLLAARAACFEPRLAGLILIDGVWSMQDCLFAAMPDIKEVWEHGDMQAVNAAFENVSEQSPTGRRWIHDHGKYSFRVDKAEDLFNMTSRMTLDGISDNIQMPTFIGDAKSDIFFLGQPQRVKAALGDKATLVEFTSEQAADDHCQSGALVYLNQRIFDWLQHVMK